MNFLWHHLKLNEFCRVLLFIFAGGMKLSRERGPCIECPLERININYRTSSEQCIRRPSCSLGKSTEESVHFKDFPSCFSLHIFPCLQERTRDGVTQTDADCFHVSISMIVMQICAPVGVRAQRPRSPGGFLQRDATGPPGHGPS